MKTDLVTPVLLPSYAPEDVRKRQLLRADNELPGTSVLHNRLHDERPGA